MAAPAQRTVAQVLVQTAKALPAVDSGWTTQRYVRFEGGSEGSNQLLGEATLVQDFGVVKAQGASTATSIGIAPDIARAAVVDDLVGLVVRLLLQDDDGIISLDGETWTAFWWGVIQTQTIQPDLADTVDTGGRVTWLAVGLVAVLDSLYLTRGWVLAHGGTAVDPGYLPPFNHQPGGDRSSSAASVNGSLVYVHQLADATSANAWTAIDIVQLLLAGAVRPALAGGTAIYGWVWGIALLDTCLSYEVEDLDLSGLSVLQALNLLASTKRGIGWTAAVVGDHVDLTFFSVSPDAIAVSGYTLPASSFTATLDAAGNPWLADLTIQQDESSTYDVIEIRGNQPWTGLTLVYPDHLEKGWNTLSESDWNAFPAYPLYEQVWRRFTLQSAWDETGLSGGLQNTVVTATNAANGVNGLSGSRVATAAGDCITGLMHEGEGSLPCGDLFSASAIGPRQQPVVVYFNGSSVYEDLSLKWRVEVQSEPFAVVIDDGRNGTELRSRMAVSGSKLYVSVGMREHRPFAVSWQRDPADFPRATPRVKLLKVSGCDLWRVPSGTVTGVNGTKVRGAVGASMTTTGAIAVRDNSTRINALLALAKAWFSVPSYRVRWTDRGILDVASTYAPGRLLTSVTLGDRTYGTYAVITRRTWQRVERDGVEMWDTVYETQRILPDLEVIL